MNLTAPAPVAFNVPGLPPPTDPKEAKKLWQASQAMEALFAKHLLHEVGKMMPGGNATASAVYGDMFEQAVAEKIAQSNNLGLSKQIYLAVDQIARRTRPPAAASEVSP